MREGPFEFDAVDVVGRVPPFVLVDRGVFAGLDGVAAVVADGLDGDDVVGLEGLDGFEESAGAAEFDELRSDLMGVHRAGLRQRVRVGKIRDGTPAAAGLFRLGGA